MRTLRGIPWRIDEVNDMGKNVKADENKANNVEITDEYGKDILKSQMDSIKKEKEYFEVQLQKAKDGRERFIKQWTRDQKIYELMLNNFSMLPEKTTMKYETFPEYWELKKQQFEDKFEQDRHMTEAKIADYDRQISAFEEEIASADTKLKELGEKNE